MKKMIPVMMLSGIIGLSACGNKTEQPGWWHDHRCG